MDPKFLRNLRYSRKHNKKSGVAEAEKLGGVTMLNTFLESLGSAVLDYV
jgi:hypothetical protein